MFLFLERIRKATVANSSVSELKSIFARLLYGFLIKRS